MSRAGMDWTPFGSSPLSPQTLGLNAVRLATDTDETEKQMTAQVEAMLSDIGSLLGTNRYYRRESEQDASYASDVHRPSLPSAPDADTARVFALTNGLPFDDSDLSAPPPQPQARAASVHDDGSLAQVRALCLQLEQARDLVRRLDSERRFYRQRALRQQKEIDHISKEKLALSVRASEGHRMSLDTENQLNAARARIRDQGATLDRQTEELLALRRFLRALPPAYAQAYDAQQEDGAAAAAPLIDALRLIPDRRFEEAFRDKMDVIGFKRRCSHARKACEVASARYEALCMACEDVDVGSTRAQIATARKAVDAGVGGEAPDHAPHAEHALTFVPAPSSYAMPTVSALLQQRRRSSVLDFPIHVPFSPATPQDAELKSLIYRSDYAEPLMEARDGLLRLSTRLKTTEENGLQNLYSLFGDVVRTLSCADRPPQLKAFEKQMDVVQRAQRELLFQLVAYVNTATADITALEKRLKQDAASSSSGAAGRGLRRACHDVGCMATDTSLDDYRLHQVESQLHQKELRLLEERGAAEKKIVSLNAELQQQQTQTLTILEALEELERSVAASTRLALRHHRASSDVIDRVSKEPFRAAVSAQPLRVQDLSDARLLAKVSDSVDMTVGCLRQLTGLTAPETPTRTDGESEAAATGLDNTGKQAKKKKKLSLTLRHRSEALRLPSAARTRSRSNTRSTSLAAKVSSPSRRTTQEDFLASTLPDFSAQMRRHTLPAVPTAALSGRSATSTKTTGRLTNGRGSVGCVPTPPTMSLAAKPEGQAPRRGSTSTTPALDDPATPAETPSKLPQPPLTASTATPPGPLTPLNVNQSDSRLSSTGTAAPAVTNTANRKSAAEEGHDCVGDGGCSPTVAAPEVKARVLTPEEGEAEPRARSATCEPVVKSREASLAQVSIVNIELFRGEAPVTSKKA